MFKKMLVVMMMLSIIVTPCILCAEGESGSSPDPDKMVRSGHIMVLTGYIISGVGAAAAIGGSAYAVAKNNDRTTAAIIGASGAGVGLIGGVITMWGYHKISMGQRLSSSIAPVIDPEGGQYGLRYSLLF